MRRKLHPDHCFGNLAPVVAWGLLGWFGTCAAIAPSLAFVRTAGGVSLDQAVKMAEQRFKARVVRAEAQQTGGRTVYELRLLNDSGRVWTIHVDASSGAVL